ncbi:MAG: amidohydrolase family protein [Acidobacteria bacterium]|nr:amidohydrolase family protein [Acidobacteriota bacterium]
MRKNVLFSVLMVIFGIAGGESQNVDVAAKLGAYPQMILYNGKIVTMSDKSFQSQVGNIVQAMAVRDGKILTTGNNADIRALAGPQTRQIDLKGREVLPGFIMTHEHPTDWAFLEPRGFRHVLPDDSVIVSRWMPNLPAKEQMAKFEPAVKEAVSKAKPGQWIRVIFNWGPDYEWATEVLDLYGSSIKREYLNQLAPNNPLLVKDGFIGETGNDRAFELHRAVHPPAPNAGQGGGGGGLGRPVNPDTMLQGKLSTLAEILKAQLDLWASYGITTFGSGYYAYSNLQAFNLLDQKGDMPARFAWSWQGPNWDVEQLRVIASLQGNGTDHLWLMGAFGSGGGCLSVPEKEEFKQQWGNAPPRYAVGERCSNAPGGSGYERNRNIAQAGLRFAATHTGGDKDIDYLLDAIEEGSKLAGMTPEQIRSKRHAFDHGAGAPRPAQIPRLKNLGMYVSQLNTILWETHRGASMIAREFGLEYTNWVVPRKTVTDAGIPNTFEIDRPLPHKVFFFITKGMNRYNDRDQMVYGPGERTDRITQLKALTTWGSYYVLRENLLGSLEPGKFADFIVLDRDFLTIPEAEIPKTQVLMTVVGGKMVHLNAALGREIGMQPVGPTTWTEPIPEGWEPKPF